MKVAAAVASVSLLGIGTVGLVSPSVAAELGSDSCVEVDAAGAQVWQGEASPALDALGNDLQALADSNPDQTTGVAYCSKFQGAAIFVSEPGEALMTSIEELRANYPELVVEIRHVAAALTELQALGDEVISAIGPEGELNGVGPDIYTGGLQLTTTAEAEFGAAELERVAAIATETLGEEVPVTVSVDEGNVPLVDRSHDTAPYYMGGALSFLLGSSWYLCSSGLPMKLGTTRLLLTAGHCSGSSFYNNNSLVGTTYTTAFPGNAKIYGDWKLLSGSTYSARVFTGMPSESTNLVISGVVWGGRPLGSGVCTSGIHTGQICRYFVVATYQTRTIEGTVVNNLLEMRHDSTGGSGADANGAKGADSGGPCYFADGKGGVTALGIVSTGNSTLGRYYCTQLSGVKAWKSAITFGT